jgi:23S rRNA pseudouridine1911/1915/1917 synthase
LFDNEHFAAVYKPQFMHTAPLSAAEEGALLSWVCKLFPEVQKISGKKAIEGGLLHRLDFGTEGLVLFARTQEAYDFLQAEQEAGRFIKTYTAKSAVHPLFLRPSPLPGFPPAPPPPEPPAQAREITSGFRPYGPGRQAVRPIIDNVAMRYSTRITSIEYIAPNHIITAQLTKGFRHQIRCHLAWIGYPLLGDTLYGGEESTEAGLSAVSLSFNSPDGEAITLRTCS